MSKGLLLPDAKGNFRFHGVKEQEERPILTYEKDTGVILLNFNAILMPEFRKLKDVILQTSGGVAMGLVLTSDPMGPEERKAYEDRLRDQKS